MTTFFAFRASEELSTSSLTLMEHFERGSKEPQSALFVKVAQLFADEIVDTLLLNLVSAESGSSHANKLEGFAGIIKSTVNSLIKQVLGKMNNDELRPLSGYIRERRQPLSFNGETHDYIVFPMPPDFHARLRGVLEQGSRGEKNADELLACMEQFHEMALTAFYDESLSKIKLGFIGRKVAEVGGAAIRKGSQSVSKHTIPHLEGDELKRFSEYFLGMLVTA
jgi:hypothetical protein